MSGITQQQTSYLPRRIAANIATLPELLRKSPQPDVRFHVPYRKTEHRDLYLSGLTLASEEKA